MAERERGRRGSTRVPGAPRIFVEDAGGRRPFMRGILVHSLMSRGVAFDEAFRTANFVRERLRGRPTVTRDELAKAVAEILEETHVAAEAGPPARVPDILVEGAAQSLPFSKGILSQSLLAAALEPMEAFDAARRIEEQLVRQGVRRIDRRELRRLTYRSLSETQGPRVATRYLVWRKYQQPDRPVIILLGGAAGAGKTTLALQVAHRLGISRVISTDAIRQVMRIMLSSELMPAIHASSYDAPNRLGETAGGAGPVVEGFLAQASIVAVGVKAMLDRAVEENTSLVLDGVAIVPGVIDLEPYADRADVIFLVVAVLDVDDYRSRFARRERGERQRGSHRYVENLGAIIKTQDYLLELADSHGVPMVVNDSVDGSVLSIIRHVTETLGKREAADARELL